MKSEILLGTDTEMTTLVGAAPCSLKYFYAIFKYFYSFAQCAVRYKLSRSSMQWTGDIYVLSSYLLTYAGGRGGQYGGVPHHLVNAPPHLPLQLQRLRDTLLGAHK